MSTTPIGSSPLRPNSSCSRSTQPCLSLLLLSEAEAAREAVLQRLPAARQARVGHEVLVRVERLLALGRPNALRRPVRPDAPALLVILQIRNHDLVHDLLVHRRVGD